MSRGYLHATKILEQLSDEKQIACLRAVNQSQQGQAKLASADWNGALTLFLTAHDSLSKIPEAKTLLGIVKADIAAAYGNLKQIAEAKRFAQEALQLVKGVDDLAFTEAMAHMTLGISHYHAKNEEEGALNFEVARRLLHKLPNTEQYLRILESNEAQFKASNLKAEKKWWHLKK